MDRKPSDLAQIIDVEVLTCVTCGDGSASRSDTVVNIKFETEQGPGAVLVSGERSRALGILDAQRERRSIPVPTP